MRFMADINSGKNTNFITRMSNFQCIIVPASFCVKLTSVSIRVPITSTDRVILESAKIWTPRPLQMDWHIMVRSCISCICNFLASTVSNFPDVLSDRTALLLHDTLVGEGDVLNTIGATNWAVDLGTLLSTFNVTFESVVLANPLSYLKS